MTYNPSKPDSGPSPKLDAPQIRADFSQFAAIFSRSSGGVFYNHTPLNNRNQGDHESIILQNQSADPGVTDDYDVLYAKNVTSKVDTQPQLFVQIPKFLPTAIDVVDAQNLPMQLTYNKVNTSGPIYQSFLPGGYLIYFGMVNDITINIVLSPEPTKILIALAEPNRLCAGAGSVPPTVSTKIIGNKTFKINSNITGTYTFTWLAIAVQ